MRGVMAHSCPDCGSVCYCYGDVDDCLLDGGDAQDACLHCSLEYCGGFDGDYYFDGVPDEEVK
jgi:hypothetical protein